jgi:hypothetical protein
MNRMFTVALISGLFAWAHAEERPFVGYLVEQYYGGMGSPAIMSGWCADTSGGSFGNGWGAIQVVDTSNTAGVSLRRRFLRQTEGTLVLEYRFNASAKVNGLTWQLQNGTQTVVNVLTSGGNLCYENSAGTAIVLQAYAANAEVGVRVVADVSLKKADLYVNGSLKAAGVAFRNPADGIDQFLLYTGTAGTLTLNQRGVHIYKGYLVNERFLAQDQGAVPDGWTTAVGGGAVSVVKDSDLAAYLDCNSAKLSDTNHSSSVSLAKGFDPQAGKVEFEFKFMQPRKNNGFTADLSNGAVPAARFITDNGNLCYVDGAGSKVSVWNNYLSNMWYFVRFTVDLGTRTGAVTINDIPRATGVGLADPLASRVDTIKFTTAVTNSDAVWLDDIQVYPFQDGPSDYVPEPVAVPHSPYRIGVQVCNLWREGAHYGWDWISSDADRSPLLGFYDEGQPEAADWEIKYMVEHGIDFFATCWYRPSTATGQSPIKDGAYHSAGLNAYKRARYSGALHYTLIVETSSGPMKSLDDWKNNAVPFLIEHYFKDPRFLVIDNKPVVCFFKGIKNTGDENAARNYLRDTCIESGFAGVTLLGCTTTGDVGFEYNFTYAQSFAAESVTNRISSPSVNWDRSAWDLPYQDRGAWRSAADYKSLLTAQKACMPGKSGLAQTMVLLGNWNEYGEGHFLMPTEGLGFRYLDGIREVFGDGSEHVDAVPSMRQKIRVNVLYPQPTVRANPVDQKVAAGREAAFSVATVGFPPLFYQWRKNASDISGATNASCVFQPAWMDDHGARFSVAVSNGVGRTVSGEAVLSVVQESPICKMKVALAGYKRGETLTNFPVLVKFSTGMTNGFAYSQVFSPFGYDVRFKDATETQELNYEVEKWNTNGESCVWVQVPRVTSNSYVWATWGNSAVAATQPACWTNSATWDSAYRAVWHMKEGAGSVLGDSTVHVNQGLLCQGAAWTNGQAGKALLFNAITTNYVDADTGDSLSLSNTFTVSAWVCPAAYITTNYYGMKNGFLSRGSSSAATLNYALETKNSTTVTFIKRTGAEGLIFYDFTVPTLTADWTLVTLKVAGGTASLYINGAPCGSKAVGAIAPASGDVMYLGCIMPSQPITAFVGGLDEVRISAVARSSDWVWADWMNVASNSVFASLGAVSASAVITDANMNGMPDLWERQYFGSTNAAGGGPNDDWDHDGMKNVAEYLAGTGPTNAASLFKITGLAADGTSGTGLVLRWSSVAGKRYALQTATNLLVGFDGSAVSNIPATPALNTRTVSVDHARSRYYRVTVEPETP